MDIGKIFELDNRAVNSIKQYGKQRFIMKKLSLLSGRPYVLLQGPRGVGKTVMLRHLRSKTAQAIYISADTLEDDESLSSVISTLYDKHGITSFFIDEIHFFPNFHQQLKEVHDFLPIHLFCTSSVALSLENTAYDLSRRVQRFLVHQCSFREYIYFLRDKLIPPLYISDIIKGEINSHYLPYAREFPHYLQGGGYLFTFERDAGPQQFAQIIETIIKSDIPKYRKTLSFDDLIKIEKTVAFIGKSPIEGINYSSVSQNIGITKYKAQQYLEILETSFLVSSVFPSGTNVLKEPKVFMEIPYRTLYRPYDECIGSLHEDFFALSMRLAQIPFTYVKSQRGKKIPDFSFSWNSMNIILEVGGKGKGRSQFKGVTYDRKIILYHSQDDLSISKDRIPLFLLGFLEAG